MSRFDTKTMKKIKAKKGPTFFSKALSYLKSLWVKHVVEPYNKKKEIRRELREIKELKRNFKKQFGVDVEHVRKQIANQKNFSNHKIEQTDKDYLLNKLIEARKALNESTCRKSPLFYEPEICDIHNENEFKWTSHTLETIKKRDSDDAKKILDNTKNHKFINRAKFLWRTRM